MPGYGPFWWRTYDTCLVPRPHIMLREQNTFDLPLDILVPLTCRMEFVARLNDVGPAGVGRNPARSGNVSISYVFYPICPPLIGFR